MIIYYTDTHDVDEDGTTISLQGGGESWAMGSNAGITFRTMDTSPTYYTPDVAYKDKNTILVDRVVFLMI